MPTVWSAAGKQVSCPFCEKTIIVPLQNSAPSHPEPTQPSGNILSSFDQELPRLETTAGGATQNPYAVSQQSYAAPQQQIGNSPVQYIVVGIIFIVFGVLWVLGSCVATIRPTQEDPNFLATPEGQGYLFGMLTLIIFSLGAIIGGISFVRPEANATLGRPRYSPVSRAFASASQFPLEFGVVFSLLANRPIDTSVSPDAI